MKRSLHIIPLTLLITPLVADAAATSFKSLAAQVVDILNAGSIAIITATIVIYMFGVSRRIYEISKEGKVKGSELSSYLMSGVLIIFVMVSIWGLIHVLQYSLFGGLPPQSSSGTIIYGSSSGTSGGSN